MHPPCPSFDLGCLFACHGLIPVGLAWSGLVVDQQLVFHHVTLLAEAAASCVKVLANSMQLQ
jgi:hypothetical protein